MRKWWSHKSGVEKFPLVSARILNKAKNQKPGSHCKRHPNKLCHVCFLSLTQIWQRSPSTHKLGKNMTLLFHVPVWVLVCVDSNTNFEDEKTACNNSMTQTVTNSCTDVHSILKAGTISLQKELIFDVLHYIQLLR